jgi:hypothetical protein
MTVIGTAPQGQTGAGRRGALLRRGTGGKIYNAIIDGFTQSGVQLDDNATAAQACTGPASLNTSGDFLALKDVIIFGNGAAASGNTTTPCSPFQWLATLEATQNVLTAVDPNIVEAPYPGAASGAAGADGYVPTSGPTTADDCESFDPGFFAHAPYMGAFAPASAPAGNWLRDMANVISFDTD